ncbi:hypothetical protein GXW82_26905 [Streptacidiphilus sp. 4-A2]|nr:hypothetical protein [Streptacidiphilus sp. 4-A2]
MTVTTARTPSVTTPGGSGVSSLAVAAAPGRDRSGAAAGRPRGLRALAGVAGHAPVRRLRMQAGTALLLVAGLLAAVLTAFGAARADLHQLATVSEPRAVAAADLDQALADLDAQHANELVVGYPSTPPPPGQSPVLVDDGVLAELTAQADRKRVSADLATLAASGPASDQGVQSLLNSLSLYDGLTGTEESSATGQAYPVVGSRRPSPSTTTTSPRTSSSRTCCHRCGRCWPAPSSRWPATGTRPSGTPGSGRCWSGCWGCWRWGCSGTGSWTWCAGTGGSSIRLLPRAAVLATTLAGTVALLGMSGQVGTAVAQGYSPYAGTAQAQVAAANAEASESRWLVDQPYRPLLQQQYTELMRTLGAPSSPDAAVPAVARTRAAYLAADAQLRTLADAGALDQASVQLTGVTRGEVAFAYYDFSVQLNRLAAQQLAVTAQHFGSAQGDLSGWTVLPVLLLAAALLLVVLGVRPRLAEFA